MIGVTKTELPARGVERERDLAASQDAAVMVAQDREQQLAAQLVRRAVPGDVEEARVL